MEYTSVSIGIFFSQIEKMKLQIYFAFLHCCYTAEDNRIPSFSFLNDTTYYIVAICLSSFACRSISKVHRKHSGTDKDLIYLFVRLSSFQLYVYPLLYQPIPIYTHYPLLLLGLSQFRKGVLQSQTDMPVFYLPFNYLFVYHPLPGLTSTSILPFIIPVPLYCIYPPPLPLCPLLSLRKPDLMMYLWVVPCKILSLAA